MPRVKPVAPRRPTGPPPKRPQTLGEPRNLTDRPSRLRMALRRLRRRVRPAAYTLGAILLLGAGTLVWRASQRADNLTTLRQRFGGIGSMLGLRVADIVVRGRTETPPPLLQAAIGVAKGDPLLGFSVEGARQRIATLASVADATVERRWPGTILISLVERHPFAVWQNQGRFALIDRNGKVLADQDVRLAPQLPLVVGAGAPADAAALLDLLAAHPAIQSHMVAAVRVGERRWNLRMTSGADVKLPETDQGVALAKLDTLQTAHQVLDRRLQVIDLRLADRIVLRPDAALPAASPVPALTAPPVMTPAAHSVRQPT